MKQFAPKKPAPTNAHNATEHQRIAAPVFWNHPVPRKAALTTDASSPQKKSSSRTAWGKRFRKKRSAHNELQENMEEQLGMDLGEINVHYDSPKPAKVHALAYTEGNEIHLAPGQEAHLPHEMAHVAQQRQGRVRPTLNLNGLSINHDRHLEQEADRIGNQAKGNQNTPSAKPQYIPKLNAQANPSAKVIQRVDVPTNFGTFRTDRFDKNANIGISMKMRFIPNPEKVNATKIGFVQAVKTTNAGGMTTGTNPTAENRRVKSGQGEGYRIDQYPESNNPLYSASNLPKEKGLEATEKKSNSAVYDAKGNAYASAPTHRLGHCWKKKNGKPNTRDAIMLDAPQGSMKAEFETTALAIDGVQKNMYYGSVQWGYEILNQNVIPHDIKIVNPGNPSANFMEAAKMWNKTPTMGELVVNANPATVARVDEKGNLIKDSLPNGTKVKMLETRIWGGLPAMLVQTLDDSGQPSTTQYLIDVVDVTDLGGSATVPLPINE